MRDPAASSHWDRLQDLVETAAEMAPQVRAAFLDDETGTDTALRDEALAILDAGLDDDAFLSPLVAEAALSPGSSVGPFRIVRALARGGMGVVFEATQETPARTVALKVMRDDLFTAASRDRFQYEIDALGALTHPGIARIYQAGIHGTIPWFAMEFVEGSRTLKAYCKEEALDVNGRIRLVGEIAAAIHHGHVNGVLHRDLKPDNLLVDNQGRTRVIDFGVARLTDGDRRMTTLKTESQSIVGTLAYMSPEQARGAAGDTRSDVYSLGAVLYELLTGRLPIEVDRADFLTSARRIVEDAPSRPATLVPALSGDTEAVLLKALEKDPERRYASAAALEQDLTCLVRGEPVEARVPGAWDRIRAFARRNKALVVSSAAILLVSLVAAAVSLTFALRSENDKSVAQARTRDAKSERDRANELLSRTLKSSVMTMSESLPRIHKLPGGAEAAVEVMRQTVEDLGTLVAQTDRSVPKVQLAFAQAYLRLGDALGNPKYANIGDAKGAAHAYARAKEVLEGVEATGDEHRQAELLRVHALIKGVELVSRKPNPPNAIRDLSLAREKLLPLVADKPSDLAMRMQLARVLGMLAAEENSRKQGDAALRWINASLAIVEAAHTQYPTQERLAGDLAQALRQRALIHMRANRVDEAIESYDRAIALLEPLAAQPAKIISSGLYAMWMGRANAASKRADFPRAEALLAKAKDAALTAAKSDPKNHIYRINLCMTLVEWVRLGEAQHGPTDDGLPPEVARARAQEASALIKELSPDASSKMVTIIGVQLDQYASGAKKAGTLMGMYGD